MTLALNMNPATTATTNADVELTAEQVEMLNQMMVQNTGMDMNTGLQTLGMFGVGMNILSLVLFITTVIGLYKLSKKLGDDNSWLAFVPLIQIYTFIKTAGYNFWKGLLILIVSFIFSMIPVFGITMAFGAVASSMDSISSMMVSTLIMSLVITLVTIFITTFFLYKGMAQRAGKGTGTAILMTLFPWCMLWIVANKTQQVGINPSAQSQSEDDIAIEL